MRGEVEGVLRAIGNRPYAEVGDLYGRMISASTGFRASVLGASVLGASVLGASDKKRPWRIIVTVVVSYEIKLYYGNLMRLLR